MSLSQIEKPLTLTAEGEKLVKESGFESIFETIKDELANRFSKEKALKQNMMYKIRQRIYG